MERIELADFLLIAEAVTGHRAEDLHRGYYCRLDAALGALGVPFLGFGDYEVYATPHEKAAAYCGAIVRYHPLVDGKKRTGFVTMIEFILRNGFAWTDGRDGQAESARPVDALAAGRLSQERFANWVAHRMYDRSSS